jgi:6-phosphogluconolactonase
MSIHPLSPNGTIGSASQIFRFTLDHPGPGAGDSQLLSNPHESIFDPSGRLMVVPDRGADIIRIFSVTGASSVASIQNITLEPGTGPRHLIYSVDNKTRTYMYLVSELDNTLQVFTIDGVDNCNGTGKVATVNPEIKQVQLLSTLGARSNRTEPNNNKLANEVALSTDGRFLYVTNRDQTTLMDDFMSVYSVNPSSGQNGTGDRLAFVGMSPLFGKIPRHYSLSGDAQSRYAAVTNEVSNAVVIIERD